MTREECDRLIKIIKSRVVGFTTAEDAENTRPSEIPNKTVGSESGYNYRIKNIQIILI